MRFLPYPTPYATPSFSLIRRSWVQISLSSQVRIPDDQSSRSQFAIIDDELEEQLRGILESNETDTESSVFKLARDQYKACMDLDQIERIGLQPLKDILKKFGGWPVLEDNWNESNFNWLVVFIFQPP